jgi:hypothetical protein
MDVVSEKSSTDTSDFPAISKKFAYLPNGIIREIIAYTGATYKKRNGKYMGQIPKTDPRFALLLKIPTKKIHVNNHLVSNPNCQYFHSWVSLTRIGERYYKHPIVRLAVFGVTYTNDPMFGNKETIEYECRICDRIGNVRCETYEYYRKDEKLDNIIAKCDDLNTQFKSIQTKIDEMEKRILIQKKSLNLLQNACIMTSMFTVGLIVQYFRN